MQLGFLAKAKVLVVGCSVLYLVVPAWGQESWTYVDSSGFKAFDTPWPATNGVLNRPLSNYHTWGDIRRVKVNSMVVDLEGRVYAACTNLNNNGSSPGGVTIFNTDGSRIDIDLSPATFGSGVDENLPGAVTKLVLAGDGKVYGLQNWLEVSFAYAAGTVSRILRFNADGSVDVIKEYSPLVTSTNGEWVNKIGGLTVGGDGYPYWWFAGATWGTGNAYWKQHVLWRYNLVTAQVEEFPLASLDPQGTDGAEQPNRMLNFEYVGTGIGSDFASYFTVLGGLGGARWVADAIRWNAHRSFDVPGAVADAGWGRDWCTATAYDKVSRRLWAGGRGTGYADPDPVKQGTNIMTMWWNDMIGDLGLYHRDNEGFLSMSGNLSWHVNDNDPQTSGVGNGGPYWITALAANSGGSAWLSIGGQIANSKKPGDGNYTFAGPWGLVGEVYKMEVDTSSTPVLTRTDMGRPHSAHPTDSINENQVVALAFGLDKVYALVLDLVNGAYSLYVEDNPDKPFKGACCMPSGCIEVAQNQCPGEFQGIGTDCDSINCSCRTCHDPFADADGDGDVDQTDFAVIQMCFTGQDGGVPNAPCRCDCYNRDNDEDVDANDLALWMLCASGPGIPADKDCD
ncbi:MAG TPA: hypothetical protein PLL20_01625 [Phycisphaerae bacterium]|nr:hypothetical protein [Phycisphaerae bacterium]HRR85900.1 hypothetical protein [Phycisphaerae bacterium]